MSEGDIFLIRKLIRPEILENPDKSSNGSYCVKLVEKEQQDYEVTIDGIPKCAIALKTDRLVLPNNFFDSSLGVLRHCDYVLITNSSECNWIVYVEMKAIENPSRENGDASRLDKVKQQLNGSACVIAFCAEAGYRFLGKNDFLSKNNYKERFVYISIGAELKFRNPTTRVNDTADDVLKLSIGPSANRLLYFNQFIGKTMYSY